ncbi:MAG: hypothetical protein U5K99_06015 [Anaerolineales bacterium]|nr:hypothetical protein [Anaerolineales bacterium]
MKVKTRFDSTHFAPDPRSYYGGVMHGLEYRNAASSVPVFAAAWRTVTALRQPSAPAMLDMASGYGVVSALMRYNIALDELLSRYVDPAIQALPASAVVARDRAWFHESGMRAEAPRSIGLDISSEALTYGEEAGLFDAVFAEDLAEGSASAALREALGDCVLMVEAGSIAHMAPRILTELLAVCPEPKPWVLTAPVRGNHRAEAVEAMRAAGLVVERMPARPFPVRRFVDADEQARACAEVRRQGLDPSGIETTGYLHGCLFLARPADETDLPAMELLPAELRSDDAGTAVREVS